MGVGVGVTTRSVGLVGAIGVAAGGAMVLPTTVAAGGAMVLPTTVVEDVP